MRSTSKESSGVRTWTAPRVSSQPRRTACSAASAASGRPWRATSARTCAASLPWPTRKTRRRVSPGPKHEADLQPGAGIEPGPEASGQGLQARAPPARTASRSAPGRRPGRRSPSAARRWRARRPRGPRTRGSRRWWPGPRRWPGRARSRRGGSARPAAGPAPTRCSRRPMRRRVRRPWLVSVRSENFTGSTCVHEDLERVADAARRALEAGDAPGVPDHEPAAGAVARQAARGWETRPRRSRRRGPGWPRRSDR